MVVRAATTKLFYKDWFDVCILDKILGVAGARRGGAEYDLLQALHCVHYDKMPSELRARIPLLVNACLKQRDDVNNAVEAALKDVT